MTVVYPNLCYNEVCYIGTALYYMTNIGDVFFEIMKQSYNFGLCL